MQQKDYGKSVTITVRTTKWQKELFKRWSRKKDISLSKLMNHAAEMYVSILRLRSKTGKQITFNEYAGIRNIIDDEI